MISEVFLLIILSVSFVICVAIVTVLARPPKDRRWK